MALTRELAARFYSGAETPPRSALARGISVRRTTGVSHGREVPLLPILSLLRDYFGITEGISPSQARVLNVIHDDHELGLTRP